MKKILGLVLITASLLFGTFAMAESSIGRLVCVGDDTSNAAEVEITATGEKYLLVLCGYNDGRLARVACASKVIDGEDSLYCEFEGEYDEVKASLLSGFSGKTLIPPTSKNADTTDLRFIKINGKYIDTYSNDVNSYSIQCDKGSAVVEAMPTDGSTLVSIEGDKSPGKATITISSSSEEERVVNVLLYADYEETYKLTGLSYRIGKDVYEVPGFAPNVTDYNIELPDNTINVTLLPESAGETSIMTKDTYVSTINNVYLGKILDVASKAYPYKRNARNGIIPIKSECGIGEITVSNGTDSTVYTLNFKAKQPRLTEFNMVGAESDSIQPMFVGGGAVNNDNGTLLMSDRGWTLSCISKELLGGSCFMFAANNKNSGTWWYKNNKGEYFNFTADTGGKIVILSGDTFTNSTEYKNNGWTAFSYNEPSPPDDLSFKSVRKDWNDYSATYFMSCLEYLDATSTTTRCVKPWIEETTQLNSLMQRSLRQGFYKTFEAGEKVSIYHTGRKDAHGSKVFAVIKWDGVDYDEE